MRNPRAPTYMACCGSWRETQHLLFFLALVHCHSAIVVLWPAATRRLGVLIVAGGGRNLQNTPATRVQNRYQWCSRRLK
ncbi:hypothetical protein F4604DRAFT_832754 [Suillus subluteus]|nr:hypothetical protein F4604DRAFT_832754 [Suillus subluteus]